MIPICRLHTLEDPHLDALAGVLVDCVDGGASVTNGDAARLYERLGWVRVGDIPDYALLPEGGLCSTTVYYRRI